MPAFFPFPHSLWNVFSRHKPPFSLAHMDACVNRLCYRARRWQALELRMRSIPVSQKVLMCSAWVDSGEYLAAAARLIAQCQADVFGIACVRFEQNRRYLLITSVGWIGLVVFARREQQ